MFILNFMICKHLSIGHQQPYWTGGYMQQCVHFKSKCLLVNNLLSKVTQIRSIHKQLFYFRFIHAELKKNCPLSSDLTPYYPGQEMLIFDDFIPQNIENQSCLPINFFFRISKYMFRDAFKKIVQRVILPPPPWRKYLKGGTKQQTQWALTG